MVAPAPPAHPAHRVHVAAGERQLQLCPVARVGDDQLRLGDGQAQAQIFRPQLLGARQNDRADPETGAHRENPLRAVADQRHHDVARADPARAQRPRQRGAAGGDLGERPLAPRAVPRELDQRAPRRGQAVDYLAGEVHAGILYGKPENDQRSATGWP
jgi:hypothetical protein